MIEVTASQGIDAAAEAVCSVLTDLDQLGSAQNAADPGSFLATGVAHPARCGIPRAPSCSEGRMRDVVTGVRARRRRRILLLVGSMVGIMAAGCGPLVATVEQQVCSNPIACENQLSGDPQTEWDVTPPLLDDMNRYVLGPPGVTPDATCGITPNSPDATCISGFATDISVNRGSTIAFKVDARYPRTNNFRIDIYRLGYYQNGDGARKVATVDHLPDAPSGQAKCQGDEVTGLKDCGNWGVSATWDVPETAVSGLYIGKLVRQDDGHVGVSSHITFIVRDDSSTSDILFQTSDETWQAYNGSRFLYDPGFESPYGRSLYNGAVKVSYNRPFTTRADMPFSWFRIGEYPMIRFLERNGYDVSYTTGVDVERNSQPITNHRIFLTVGHDEYWSAQQRANVEAARDSGVSLAFFSGNEMFWKTRWEGSYRTLVTYKETLHDLEIPRKVDPSSAWTGTWRDPSYSPPSDGGRPENAVTGTLPMVDAWSFMPLTVSAEAGQMRFWANTTASHGGARITGGAQCQCIIGHEWDEDVDNGFRPRGLVRLSSSVPPGDPPGSVLAWFDYGTNAGLKPKVATHSLTLYREPTNHALVFGAGTVDWAWALDANHDDWPAKRGGSPGDPTIETDLQQATVNLLADMGAQPSTLQTDPLLHSASQTTDVMKPTSSLTVSSMVDIGTPITINGTAHDNGGGVVGGVEISVDSGSTWHPMSRAANWTYSWTPAIIAPVGAPVNVLSRATDDSGNTETASVAVPVQVRPRADHALLFYNSAFSANGYHAVGRLADDGTFTTQSFGTGFSWGWTHVVEGGDHFVLFYSSINGAFDVGRLGHDGVFTDLLKTGTECLNWTNIAITSDNIVLFYSNSGTCGSGYNYLIGRIMPDGEILRLSVGTFSPGFTSLAVTTDNIVLFYNQSNGLARTGALDRNGGYRDLVAYSGWVAGYTHVVAGVNDLVVLYKASNGTRVIGRLDKNGVFATVSSGTWSAQWDSIVAGLNNTVLLFYRASDGYTAIGRLDQNGVFADVVQYTGLLSTGWTHIVAE